MIPMEKFLKLRCTQTSGNNQSVTSSIQLPVCGASKEDTNQITILRWNTHTHIYIYSIWHQNSPWKSCNYDKWCIIQVLKRDQASWIAAPSSSSIPMFFLLMVPSGDLFMNACEFPGYMCTSCGTPDAFRFFSKALAAWDMIKHVKTKMLLIKFKTHSSEQNINTFVLSLSLLITFRFSILTPYFPYYFLSFYYYLAFIVT